MGLLVTFFPVIAFAGIFYFLLFRPQQQTNKKRQEMLAGVKKGDRVLTSGGLYGTVVNIRGDILDLKLADNVKVELSRSGLTRVIAPGAVITPDGKSPANAK